MKSRKNIALIGNPNSGKSSLFNAMTGLDQKIGNFPGVTVEKRTGYSKLTHSKGVSIIDLPGSYSIYPRRADESVAYVSLMDPWGTSNIDTYIVVADASNLTRNLLYVSQVKDLGKPIIVALTMMDILERRGTVIDVSLLSRLLGVPVVCINPRKNEGIDELDKVLLDHANREDEGMRADFIDISAFCDDPIKKVKEIFTKLTNYGALQYLLNHEPFNLSDEVHAKLNSIKKDASINASRLQAEDIQRRYSKIKDIVRQTTSDKHASERNLTEKIDRILLHRSYGLLVMLSILFIMFQTVFVISDYPMTWIDEFFSYLSGKTADLLGDRWYADLFVNGILAGLGGILIFVPQIMIVFGMITVLEDTGYMARISFLMDKFMRRIGLNGKSVMPMISGFACAVPAIMSARNIENQKERLLTILVTPLMSCSARIPVYSILISLVIPKHMIFGFISLQGLVMLGLYMLGFLMAILMSLIFEMIVNMKEKSFFILEMPTYRAPRWGNILTTMVDKAKIFVWDAGKVIMVISLILWGLSSYGPSEERSLITTKYEQMKSMMTDHTDSIETVYKSELLEHSFAGILGKKITPLIEPLGFDWKIGIALITSFAAREVFVGTMATLYSVGGDADEETTLKDKMAAAVRADGTKVYTLATGVSLLIFYVLAMQCMSTLAIVKRETGTWKWPLIQLVYMTGLAYLLSFISFIILK
ncbi:MAG: ferrous iron transport protein B [Chitinophagaceae bacterium]|jgi:ferrous iron transport protein B